MPVLEDAKRSIEQLTGLGRPAPKMLASLVRARTPHTYRFKDDGVTPNNPRFAMILYRSPVALRDEFDPAAVFEELFDANDWGESWRDSMYDFLHFHTHTHEVLGLARGKLRAEFGGGAGKILGLKAGDVVILPAGTGHRRLAASKDLLVVGAYPPRGTYDEPKPHDVPHDKAVASIAHVPAPKSDPVYGKDGPLLRLWAG